MNMKHTEKFWLNFYYIFQAYVLRYLYKCFRRARAREREREREKNNRQK